VIGLLVLPCFLATHAPATEKSVWLLQGTGWQREETALLYSLRIYTRDLRIPITISVLPSQGETEEDQRDGAKSRCALGASLVAWFGGDEDGPHLRVLRCASGEEHQLPLVPPKDPELAAQTLALKLRGLLMEVTAADAVDDLLASVAQPEPRAEPGTRESETRPGRAGEDPNEQDPAVHPRLSQAESRDEEGAKAARPARRQSVEAGLDWVYGVSSEFASVRQGLLLRLGVAFARLPLALEMDGAVVTSTTKKGVGYQLAVTESPIIGLTLSARLARRWWTVSLGPRVSMHYVSADGFGPGGRTGTTATVAVGLGAMERILLHVSDAVSFGLSLSNEALVPRQRFTLDGQTRFDVGSFHWMVSAGVVVRP
jgi:hypothetical protein